MMFFQAATALFTLALAGVKAQDNDQDSICDKYSKAIFMNNNATSQKTLLTLVVNTALIGNYSSAANQSYPAFGGILGQEGDLAKYFDGSMDTTNRGGMKTKVNFLDGGAATPLMNNTAADDMNSNQYRLVTHLYEYFGALLGCSSQSDDDDSAFMKYQGDGSMSKVHRFMDLNAQEINYFISQVGAAAASFGVSSADITKVANSLNSTFNYKCLPPASVAGSAKVSQSICLAESCPEASPSNCTASTNSFPDAAAAATTDTSAENDSNSNTNNNGDDADQSTGGSTGGSTGSDGSTDGASHQMASYAIGATLGLGALAVATLF